MTDHTPPGGGASRRQRHHRQLQHRPSAGRDVRRGRGGAAACRCRTSWSTTPPATAPPPCCSERYRRRGADRERRERRLRAGQQPGARPGARPLCAASQHRCLRRRRRLERTVRLPRAHPECERARRAPGRPRRRAAAFVPLLPDALERVPRAHRARSLLPRHAAGRRHELGPRLGARMRLGARLLLPGAQGSDRPRSACSIRATSSTSRRSTIAVPIKAAGWKVVYFPDTTVVHIGGESAKSRGQAHHERPADLGAADRERAPLLPQAPSALGGAWSALLAGSLGDAILAMRGGRRRAASTAWRRSGVNRPCVVIAARAPGRLRHPLTR